MLAWVRVSPRRQFQVIRAEEVGRVSITDELLTPIGLAWRDLTEFVRERV
jgi:hypothetical protein